MQQQLAAKFIIYYRDLPMMLVHFIEADGQIALIKDGLYKHNGTSCPRLTLFVYRVSQNDLKRIKKLEGSLQSLEKNNQIISYKKVAS